MYFEIFFQVFNIKDLGYFKLFQGRFKILKFFVFELWAPYYEHAYIEANYEASLNFLVVVEVKMCVIIFVRWVAVDFKS